LRLSVAIVTLIFSLAPLLVLRLSIGVPALFLRLPSLLLLVVLSLLTLSLILIVALCSIFADLRALLVTVRAVLSGDYTHAPAEGDAQHH